jgi:hypothetical protein
VTRVGIHQPNYAPWAGYFAKVAATDVFVFLDDVQMPTGRSYVYRTSVPSGDGTAWLSVPTSAPSGSSIDAVRFADPEWGTKHVDRLRSIYRRAPHFDTVSELIVPIYEAPGDVLGAFNMRLIRAVAEFLGLSRRWERSSTLAPEGTADDRLISITQLVGGDTYVSGAGGQNYQSSEKFRAAGLTLEVHQYRPVPYRQFDDAFTPGLTILDALFHVGRDARRLLEYPVLDASAGASRD